MKNILLFILLLFIGCSSKDQYGERSFSDLLYNLKIQEFSLQTKRDTSIVGINNTVLKIPKNAFRDSLGNSYKSFVQLRLIECYTRRDIIESGIETSSYGNPLVSFGYVNIMAMDSLGNDLFLRNGTYIQLYLDTGYFVTGFNPEIFYGFSNSKGINWRPDSSFIKEEIVHETRIGHILYVNLKGYSINAPKLGWINLDSFYDLKPYEFVNLTVVLKRDINMSIKLVLLDFRSVFASERSENNRVFFERLPTGKRAALLVYGIEGDSPYFGYKEIITGEILETSLDIEYCSFEELNTKFAELDY